VLKNADAFEASEMPVIPKQFCVGSIASSANRIKNPIQTKPD
jgi:hypothetical protein